MSEMRDQLLAELAAARATVARLEAALDEVNLDRDNSTSSNVANEERHAPRPRKAAARDWPLDLREYMRYGRQMILPQIGQLKLKHAHVLVVGAGGLGCPVLLYLAAAGVGQITIMDHDTVELSNLHRQVLHTEDRVGMSKAESAKQALVALNSDVRVEAVQLAFIPAIFHPPTGQTPSELLEGRYTLILDCSDNPATRHFLNAYAAAHQIPLVSGGAVRAEGTVGVFNLPLTGSASDDDNRGPCYACIFPPSGPPPSPPPPLSVSQFEALTDQERKERERLEDLYYERLSLSGTGACADEGVVGILCGVVGIGMASEAMRVLLGIATPTLHLYSPLSSSPYRTIKMRARKPTCPACGTPSPSSPSSTATSRWQDFLARRDATWPGWSDPLCETPGVGQRVSSSSGRADSRIRVQDLHERLGSSPVKKSVLIVDTRPASEYGIANLEGSINIPFPRLLKDPSLALTAAAHDPSDDSPPVPDRITFVCRRGNDSLLASRALRRYLEEHAAAGAGQNEETAERIEGKTVEVDDLIGGLSAWAREGEEGFPVY
ncbi:Urmylation protein [Rhodotorula mucilaginosa]|uniref:Urmylation protein n=1 Tax=Rhodotorula mucilaginosa TaxID=5537 RepID=A0A9P6VTQ0_RHOMI|nr:Urmylation protein [Rhodotorula mucilaginosa]